LELLRPLGRSAGDFESSYDLSTSSVGHLVPYSHTSGSFGSITTRYLFHRSYWSLYSYKICYIIIWQLLSKSLYIYEYGDTGIMELDSATGSIYLGDRGVDRHHLIIGNTHSIFPRSWSHALLPSFVDLRNLY